jgi:hypothetical protein
MRAKDLIVPILCVCISLLVGITIGKQSAPACDNQSDAYTRGYAVGYIDAWNTAYAVADSLWKCKETRHVPGF